MRNTRRACCLLAPALLTACNFAPHYQVPATAPTPVAYKETGPWTPAVPADATPRGPWWQIFNDPTLNTLEDSIEKANPQLAAALARYEQAIAQAHIARADLYPQVDADASGQRGRTLQFGDEHQYSGEVTLSYEVDLWGRVRNEVAAAKADATASKADLASTRLSLEGELADDYMQMRGLDGELAVLRQTQNAYAQALDLTRKRYVGGASSEIDVARAQTQFSDAQSQFEQTGADRAVYEHAIAALVGQDASSFSIPPVEAPIEPPHIPLTAPSVLLQRRPDVAAAERRVFSANARIGEARAARYPQITLGASGGYASIESTIVNSTGLIWALGPAMAALALIDGGRRRAEIARTKGAYDEAAANYRQTTLDAFRDVEDELARCNRLATSEDREQEAVTAASRTNTLATIQYRDGAVDYLQVVVAQTAELTARRTEVQLHTRRLTAGVDLIRALGGGWTEHG